MKLQYISKNKRRYAMLGKEFPNKDTDKNMIEVEDSLGKLLLCERVGSVAVWQKIEE